MVASLSSDLLPHENTMSLPSEGYCFQDAILGEILVLPDFTSAATFIRIFCLKSLKRAFPVFISQSAPGALWQMREGTLRYILRTVTV